MLICDICLVHHDELWGFPVAEFFEPVTIVRNIAGEWAVCDECKPLIEARDAQRTRGAPEYGAARVPAVRALLCVALCPHQGSVRPDPGSDDAALRRLR